MNDPIGESLAAVKKDIEIVLEMAEDNFVTATGRKEKKNDCFARIRRTLLYAWDYAYTKRV